MCAMSIAQASTVLAAESAEGGINPYVVGAIALVILFGMLLALVGFAGGRDHS